MKEKGFTLVELLAVLIILGVVALLITPKVITSLDEAEKNSNMTSIKELVKTAELKHSNNEILGTTENITIDYQKNINTDYLEYKGEKPEIGKINIKKNGDIAISVKIGDNCYTKKYFEEDIEVIEFDENTCGSNSLVFTNYELPEIVLSGDGLYESTIDKGRYIYKGANPNNYIWLDENGDNTKTQTEIYRIISYEEDGAIKVIRNESIGTYPWDYNENSLRNDSNNSFCVMDDFLGCNAWGNQSNTYLNGTLLNNSFYYQYYLDNKTTQKTNSNKGTVTTDSSLNIYLNNEWLQSVSNINEQIINYSFNVGGLYYYNGYKEGDKGLKKEKQETKFSTWNGKIGLMSVTDPIESSLNPSCTSVYSNYYNNLDYLDVDKSTFSWPCKENNWIYVYKDEWMITPFSRNNNNAWSLQKSGFIRNYAANTLYDVRPSFYLKSTIKLSGLGTIEEPYYIVES